MSEEQKTLLRRYVDLVVKRRGKVATKNELAELVTIRETLKLTHREILVAARELTLRNY